MLLRAYAAGVFPMAEARDSDELSWFDPVMRGILPLDAFHLPRRLLRRVLSDAFTVTTDQDFAGVIAACAEPRPDAPDTWINPHIQALYTTLHRQGFAHSVECWRDGVLVGGLYGVAIGAAFFGESMFSCATDASKVALVHLVARLRIGGWRLLDTQFVTSHLSQFGTIEIPRASYKRLLATAITRRTDWHLSPEPARLVAEFRAIAASG